MAITGPLLPEFSLILISVFFWLWLPSLFLFLSVDWLSASLDRSLRSFMALAGVGEPIQALAADI